MTRNSGPASGTSKGPIRPDKTAPATIAPDAMLFLGCGAIRAEYESGTFVAGKLVRPSIQREFILEEARNRQHPKAVEKVEGLLPQSMGELAR